VPLGVTAAGSTRTAPLEKTLRDLVDFELINKMAGRLTVGAAHVRTSTMKYLRQPRPMPVGVKHVMAPERCRRISRGTIDGELYWDGGILSNTPTEAGSSTTIAQELADLRRASLEPMGDEPTSIWRCSTGKRTSSIRAASRATSRASGSLHQMRHIISDLAKMLPEGVRTLAAGAPPHGLRLPDHHACGALLAPAARQARTTHRISISAPAASACAGRRVTRNHAGARPGPWEQAFDPLDGVICTSPNPRCSRPNRSCRTPLAALTLPHAAGSITRLAPDLDSSSSRRFSPWDCSPTQAILAVAARAYQGRPARDGSAVKRRTFGMAVAGLTFAAVRSPYRRGGSAFFISLGSSRYRRIARDVREPRCLLRRCAWPQWVVCMASAFTLTLA